jgi:hypothetical protein
VDCRSGKSRFLDPHPPNNLALNNSGVRGVNIGGFSNDKLLRIL